MKALMMSIMVLLMASSTAFACPTSTPYWAPADQSRLMVSAYEQANHYIAYDRLLHRSMDNKSSRRWGFYHGQEVTIGWWDGLRLCEQDKTYQGTHFLTHGSLFFEFEDRQTRSSLRYSLIGTVSALDLQGTNRQDDQYLFEGLIAHFLRLQITPWIALVGGVTVSDGFSDDVRRATAEFDDVAAPYFFRLEVPVAEISFNVLAGSARSSRTVYFDVRDLSLGWGSLFGAAKLAYHGDERRVFSVLGLAWQKTFSTQHHATPRDKWWTHEVSLGADVATNYDRFSLRYLEAKARYQLRYDYNDRKNKGTRGYLLGQLNASMSYFTDSRLRPVAGRHAVGGHALQISGGWGGTFASFYLDMATSQNQAQNLSRNIQLQDATSYKTQLRMQLLF